MYEEQLIDWIFIILNNVSQTKVGTCFSAIGPADQTTHNILLPQFGEGIIAYDNPYCSSVATCFGKPVLNNQAKKITLETTKLAKWEILFFFLLGNYFHLRLLCFCSYLDLSL